MEYSLTTAKNSVTDVKSLKVGVHYSAETDQCAATGKQCSADTVQYFIVVGRAENDNSLALLAIYMLI